MYVQKNDYLRELLVELTDSKAKLEEYRISTQATINSLGEGLIVTDVRGRITTINPYALESLGFQEDELLGQWFPRSIVAVDQHSHPIPQLDRIIIRALTTGQTVSGRTRYLRKNGSVMPVFITVSPVLIDGRPTGAIEVFRDLTGETQLELAKDEFVSLASHQLRTPATGVKLILSMLSQGDFGDLTPKQKKYVDKAIQSNDHQLHIIESLLSAAQVDSGRMELERDSTDLVRVLHEAVNEHMAIIQDKQQEVFMDTPPKLILTIDVSKIRMVIDNLLSNASKYSNPGDRIEIELTQQGPHIQLSVTDHGVGMPTADLKKLFTKFTRIKNELSTSAGGTGLGLFLVKNIVELHQGTVTVISDPGQGSKFTITLPSNQDV
ncbi:MAG: multi-sensor signal transduction histidine kinase [Patescibacteria group bacterium]|nr:multi-sensor signal transduction histidine kinase [Patescibacteria group bacterium]